MQGSIPLFLTKPPDHRTALVNFTFFLEKNMSILQVQPISSATVNLSHSVCLADQVDWWGRPNEKKPVRVKIRYKNPKGYQPEISPRSHPQPPPYTSNKEIL